MTYEELMEVRQREPGQKCLTKDCKNCFHYRPWPAQDKGGKPIGLMKACSIETIAVTLRSLIGAIDGTQKAANEARNAVFNYGAASVKTLDVISVQLDINKELLE